MRLKDKVVVVTAATRGIGAACVKACAEEGAIVYIGARRMDAAQKMADEFCAKGFRVHAVFNDATIQDSFASMVDTVVDNEGRIDVLVNNFGTDDPRTDLDIKHTQFEDFQRTLNLNIGSVFLASQAAIHYMTSNGGGSIINISSIGGLRPDISQIAYGTSKAAINYLTQQIAVQVGRDGIRCNAVLPGMTATDAVMTHLNDQFREFFLRHMPIKRMVKPEEIAAAVVYFASDESACTTGQIMDISGGFGLPTPIFADVQGRQNQRS